MDPKHVALLLAILSVASIFYNQVENKPEVSEFESWKAKHGITFDSMFENAYRERIFLENKAKVELHNAKKDRTYEEGLNHLSHLTQEEFEAMYLGLVLPEGFEVAENIEDEIIVAGNVDWVSQGAVTPIKNQGQCGSCWAFSTTGALEGLSKLAYGQLQSFSEQQLVDCSGKYGNMACNGGLMDNAFKYVRDNGIVHEDEYPYKAVKQTCKQDSGSFKISGFTDIKSCNQLTSEIAGRPISVAVDATNWSRYSSGVFNNCRTSLNHGVLLVGIQDGNWWIKNSWGTTWGEKGFIRLASGNTCGVCNVASYPNK